MKAKVKENKQVIDVKLVDSPANSEWYAWTYEDVANGDRYLGSELTFDDLTDYKSFCESLVHDLAVAAYHCHNGEVPSEKRKAVADDIVLLAFAITDRLIQENKTWR